MIWLTLALDLLRRFWRPIAAALAGIAIYLRGRTDAAHKAEHQADEHALEAEHDRAKVEADTRRLPADAIRDELRRGWTRDR